MNASEKQIDVGDIVIVTNPVQYTLWVRHKEDEGRPLTPEIRYDEVGDLNVGEAVVVVGPIDEGYFPVLSSLGVGEISKQAFIEIEHDTLAV